MPRPKKTTTDQAAPITPLEALKTAERNFEKLPSLNNWSKVEIAANAYRTAWLATLDATPIVTNGHSAE